MSSLPIVTEEAEVEYDSLESDLAWLHQQCMAVGLPRYSGCSDGSWHACIKVPTNRPGCTAEIRSDFNHATLSDAMRAVLSRLEDAK